jgi:hypothetical protein
MSSILDVHCPACGAARTGQGFVRQETRPDPHAARVKAADGALREPSPFVAVAWLPDHADPAEHLADAVAGWYSGLARYGAHPTGRPRARLRNAADLPAELRMYYTAVFDPQPMPSRLWYVEGEAVVRA